MTEQPKYQTVTRKAKAAMTWHARAIAHTVATLPTVWYERSFDRYALLATDPCRTRRLGA